jgi:SNF2 family DNA or RNA helicase
MAWKPDDESFRLRPYQVEDVQTLIKKRRVLLAADTGTGKTCSYIRACERLLFQEKVNAWFIFCPAATVRQVYNEIKRLTTSRAVMMIGSVQQRKDKRKLARKDVIKYVIIPMSVTLWNEKNQILKLMNYRKGENEVGIIIDEAYYLKSGPVDIPHGARMAKRVKAMFGMREEFAYRFCVTGTPIQNTPEDAYWIFFFLLGKKLLGTKEEFDARYIIKDSWGNPRGVRNLEQFHAIIKPRMIRRKETDPEVAKYLPKMITENIEIEMDDPKMRQMYSIIRQDTMESLEALAHFGPDEKMTPEKREMKNNILRQAQSRAATLQMLCVGGTEVIKRHALMQLEKNVKLAEQDKKSKKTYALRLYKRHKSMFENTTMGDKIPTATELIKDILREEPDYKIVIFSHYRHAADMIYEQLVKAKIKTRSHNENNELITVPVGIVMSKGGSNEQYKKDLFNNDRDTRIFITTDANREGVDLPAGSHLFHFDMPYNHAIWHQRSTRIRRTGSKHKRVHIFNLLLDGTVEGRTWDHIIRTKAMSSAIIDGKRHKRDAVGVSRTKTLSGLKLHESTLYSFIKNDGFGKEKVA